MREPLRAASRPKKWLQQLHLVRKCVGVWTYLLLLLFMYSMASFIYFLCRSTTTDSHSDTNQPLVSPFCSIDCKPETYVKAEIMK